MWLERGAVFFCQLRAMLGKTVRTLLGRPAAALTIFTIIPIFLLAVYLAYTGTARPPVWNVPSKAGDLACQRFGAVRLRMWSFSCCEYGSKQTPAFDGVAWGSDLIGYD